MYGIYSMIAALFILAFLLILYKPSVQETEGFAVAAVHPTLVPACVERSTDAQSLLARLASFPQGHTDADEIRLLVSKLCCLEADIAAPSAGTYRTMPLQFRTSHDMEAPSSFVGRCLRNAVRQRDIDLVIEKYETRGRELIVKLIGDCPDAAKEFDAIIVRTRVAMVSFCLKPQPVMDRPIGARDMGFWESEEVAELAQYQGVSATPK
jgi:hypothetical protein